MDMATLIGLGAVVVGAGLSYFRVCRRTWKSRLRSLGLDHHGEGVVEGRGIRVSEQRGVLTISVCIVNRNRLYDEVRADDLLALARWIPPLTRAQLAALAPLRGEWRTCIEGRTLRLIGRSASIRRPELLSYLIYLACDLAEGVDSRRFSTRAAMAR
jgi:hypothetical protein